MISFISEVVKPGFRFLANFPCVVYGMRYETGNRHLMPRRVRGVLHRTVDLLADSGNAGGETGGRAVHSSRRGVPLPDFRFAGTSPRLRFARARSRDVRLRPRGSACLSLVAGRGNPLIRRFLHTGEIGVEFGVDADAFRLLAGDEFREAGTFDAEHFDAFVLLRMGFDFHV